MHYIPALACSTLILLGAAAPAVAATPEPAPPAVENSSERSAHHRDGQPVGGRPELTPPAHSNGNPPAEQAPPAEPSHGGGDPAQHSNGNPTPTERYPLCHATGSDSNPYVHIEVALPAIRAGHGGHDDIIPPVEGYTSGTNWDAEGQAIFANGCEADATVAVSGFRAFATGAPAALETEVQLPTASLPQRRGGPRDGDLPTLALTGQSAPWLIGALALGLAAAGGAGLWVARRRTADGTILPGDDAAAGPRA